MTVGFNYSKRQAEPIMQVVQDDRYAPCPLAYVSQAYPCATVNQALALKDTFKREGYPAWVSGTQVIVLLSTMGE